MVEKINKNYKTIKKALKKSLFANPFSLGQYSLSPYMACSHACAYCDGRAERYYVEGDFGKDIIIRKNLPEILKTEISKQREKGIISMGSGITDIYQPVEKEENLTRQCAEIIEQSSFSVTLMTKSSLILRDIDLWEKINKKSSVILSISLTFLDDNQRKIFEPGASFVKERLEVIKEFKKRGIPVGVLFMPLIPNISDTEKNIMQMYKTLSDMNIDFIMPGGLTLRPGRQKEYFLGIIEKNYPEHLKNMHKIFIEDRASGNSIFKYREGLYKKFKKAHEKYEIPSLPSHSLYKNAMAKYDEIYLLLCHMMDLYSYKGIDTKNLKNAFNNFSSWLEKEKRIFNRKRSIKQSELEEIFIKTVESENFNQIIKNEKTAEFIKQIVLENKTFNYVKLKNYSL